MKAPLVALLLLLASPAAALDPGERLDDPALEARARALTLTLKCLVCQGESIDGSNADFARDLRRLVREKLSAGDSEAEIVTFLRARFGDAILLDPPLDPATWGLWLGPFALLLGGGAVLLWRARRSAAASGAASGAGPDETDDSDPAADAVPDDRPRA